MGSIRQDPFSRIENLTFRVYTDEEIEKISVIHVTNEISLNSLGHLLDNGIYDLHMGPMNLNDDDVCKTCKNRFVRCSGHCGHISLPLPVCNPFFCDVIREILVRVCPSCYRYQVKANRGIQFVYECMLFTAGYDLQSLDVSSIVSRFINEPEEAIEMPTTIDETEHPATPAEHINILFSMEKKLKMYFKKIKKDVEPSKMTTCNSQAIYAHLKKKFLDDTKTMLRPSCMYCKENLLHLKFQNSRILITNSEKSSGREEREGKKRFQESLVPKSQPYLTPKQAQTMLRECFKKDGYILKNLYPFLAKSDLANPTDIVFLQKLLVIPPKYRPCNKSKGVLTENELGFLYKAVLRLTKCLRFMVQYKEKDISEFPETLAYLVSEFKGNTQIEKSHTIWHELQSAVDNILDSSMNPGPKTAKKGIRQIIEKKFGLFRRNLMGKRVDFSARSVAAPDAMLAVDEVGVPKDFALKLTYPVPVTHWNVPKLRKLVQNGPLNYPGALMVEDEEGKRITLKAHDNSQRNAIARSLLTPAESCVKKVNATKLVYRHLQNGDYVLVNRQPTLHKPSIQAHKARLMPKDKVLRLPYANCKAYNADFDGDELNLHFPQNEMARSEAQYIVTTQNQYLTPKDGSPLAGLIQDCVVASVMLTVRGKFFPLEDYQQLVYIAVAELPRKIRLLPPAIMKPRKLWSGKQIISTILLNIIPEGKAKPSFKFKTTVKVDLWQREEPREWKGGGLPETRRESMTESEFILRDGELVCGVVDKCAIGSTSYGLVHTCYDLYGGSVAARVLTSVNRLCVVYLQWVGHTISLKEFVTPTKVARKRRKDLKKLIQGAELEVKKKLNVIENDLSEHIEFLHKSKSEEEMSAVDAAYTSVLGPTTSSITSENEKKLYRNNLRNRMRMMVDTGAKGSKVNMNQMASLFGSVAIDGKRMPMSITGKTLPSFKPYDCDPRAGGYIPTRFVTGMDPKSYFFLCIVGRDSLQHTAVKTANSGYMQRCLIKHLEGIHVKYDMTVRNSDGVVLQFQYGEDGLDVSKVPFLKDVNTIDSLLENYYRCLNEKDLSIALSSKSPQIDKYKKWVKKYRHKTKKENRNGAFLKFCREQKSTQESLQSINLSNGRSEETLQLMRKWNRMTPREKSRYQSSEEKLKRGRNPVSSVFCGASCFGVVSEALDALIDDYYDQKYSTRRAQEQSLSKEEVVTALHMKALNSRVDPGEAVGALCAQAIGEPLTQMTLNTFHFAGRDELNVTLGVPRMIEILRTASEKINTPIMEVPFKPHVTSSIAEKLKIKLTPVPLEKIINKVSVTTSLEKKGRLYRRTELLFNFLPHKEYKKVYFVKPKDVLEFMERSFIKKVLIREIKAAINKVNIYEVSTRMEKKKDANEEEEEDEGGVGEVSKRGLGEEDDSSEEENNDQSGDIDVSTASREQKKEEKDYSEDEEEENEIENNDVGQDEDDDEEEEQQKMKVKNSIDDILVSEDEGLGNEEEFSPSRKQKEIDEEEVKIKVSPKKIKQEITENEYLSFRNRVISQDRWIADYDFDRENGLWCKVILNLPLAEGRYDFASILQKVSQKTLVHSMANIKKAFVVRKEDHLLLRTEGVNIQKICSYENILDINRLYTNNIHLMAQRYGIEAAQRCIIKEIREVQSAYDIKVDFRHLSLLADYFTCEGVYKACSRCAINTCSSPIQKMSYETCFKFLKNALLQGLADNMSSPSANVLVGQPIKVGTNCMDIISKLTIDAH